MKTIWEGGQLFVLWAPEVFVSVYLRPEAGGVQVKLQEVFCTSSCLCVGICNRQSVLPLIMLGFFPLCL